MELNDAEEMTGRGETDVRVEQLRISGFPRTLVAQNRVGLNQAVVREQPEKMATGSSFTQVCVPFDGDSCRLLDVYHRFQATPCRGLTRYDTVIRPGVPIETSWACTVPSSRSLRQPAQDSGAVVRRPIHQSGNRVTLRQAVKHEHYTPDSCRCSRSLPRSSEGFSHGDS